MNDAQRKIVERRIKYLRAFAKQMQDMGSGDPDDLAEADALAVLLAQSTPPREPTPAAQWRVNGEPDPHGTRYDCERAALVMGKLTDDELANGLFMNYDQPLNIPGILAGTHSSPITWVTAAKDRIRWLSRKLAERDAAPDSAPDPEPTMADWSRARELSRQGRSDTDPYYISPEEERLLEDRERRESAARYRWLRDNRQETPDEHGVGAQLYFGTYAAGGLDAAIDAAIAAQADAREPVAAPCPVCGGPGTCTHYA